MSALFYLNIKCVRLKAIFDIFIKHNVYDLFDNVCHVDDISGPHTADN